MARSKKEPKKISPEQRLQERWDQQVFFLKKSFPKADRLIQDVQKTYGRKGDLFRPSEDAITALSDLYFTLKAQIAPQPQHPGFRPTTL